MTIRERLIRWLGGVPKPKEEIEFKAIGTRKIARVQAYTIVNAYDIPADGDFVANNRIRHALVEELAKRLFQSDAVTIECREELDCTSGPGTYRIIAEAEVVRR